MAKRILRSDNPREQKALGRQVANFEEGKWKSACRDIVKKGNLAKVGTTTRLSTATMMGKLRSAPSNMFFALIFIAGKSSYQDVM